MQTLGGETSDFNPISAERELRAMRFRNFYSSTAAGILGVVRAHFPDSAEILELSCGRGNLLAMLKEAGFAATGTNYSQYPDALPGHDVINGVDVTADCSFADKRYDCVIFSECIQNIADHYKVYQMISRLLKEGGIAIVSTPNTNSIKSRLHFLFTGFFKVKWNFIGFDVPYDEAFCYHNHPVHIPLDMYYAHQSDLTLEKVNGINLKLKNLLPYVLLILPIHLLTWINVTKREPYLAKSVFAKRLYRHLTGFKALTAERLVLIFKKERHEEKTRTTPKVSWNKKFK